MDNIKVASYRASFSVNHECNAHDGYKSPDMYLWFLSLPPKYGPNTASWLLPLVVLVIDLESYCIANITSSLLSLEGAHNSSMLYFKSPLLAMTLEAYCFALLKSLSLSKSQPRVK